MNNDLVKEGSLEMKVPELWATWLDFNSASELFGYSESTEVVIDVASRGNIYSSEREGCRQNGLHWLFRNRWPWK